MKKEERIKNCKYYKGEKEFPQSLLDNSKKAYLFWSAEKMYVENTDVNIEAEIVQQYLDVGLASANLDLPLFLSACLFSFYNRYSDNDPLVSAAYYVKLVLPDYLGSTVMTI